MTFLQNLQHRYPTHVIPGPITGLVLDSRQVTSGALFVALEGHHQDGWSFVKQAIGQGAALILTNSRQWQSLGDVPVIYDEDLAEILPSLAAEFYQFPCKSLRLIGITGTNGKTSVAQFTAQLLELTGHRCGYIGTNGYGRLGALKAQGNTTPDTITLHRMLSEMVHDSVQYCAIEVSSHGLVQGRLDALAFEATCFTNLSRDHLDYHHTLEAYAEAKFRLFQNFESAAKVINRDDSWGRNLMSRLSEQTGVLGFSVNSLDNDADIQARDVVCHNAGVSFEMTTPWGNTALSVPLFGVFNISNLLAASSLVLSMGVSFAAVAAALPKIQPVEGRMEFIANTTGRAIVVDYAHTPDALEKAITAMRHHCQGNLWVVFGCGGDRDKGKRPLMASIAEQLADRIVVTDDNPRTESSDAIMSGIATGFSNEMAQYVTYLSNRAEAISFAINQAKTGDAILVAGKGHEDYQVIGTTSHPFSDQATIGRCLEVTS